jgi:hypothetical protein
LLTFKTVPSFGCGQVITYNIYVGTVCGRYRPDFGIDAGTQFVIVEVDEFSYNSYGKSCESIRQENNVQALGYPSVFSRYNPDAHHDPNHKELDVYQETEKPY